MRSDFVRGPDDLSIGSLDQINRAQHMLVLVGSKWGQWQDAEVRAFRHQSALDERPRFLLPILVEPSLSVPISLRSYKTIDLREGVEHAVWSIEQIIGEGPAMA